MNFNGTDYVVSDQVFDAVQGRLRAGAAARAPTSKQQSLASLGIDPRSWLTNPKNEGEAKVGDDRHDQDHGRRRRRQAARRRQHGAREGRLARRPELAQLPEQLTAEQKQQVADAIKDLSRSRSTPARTTRSCAAWWSTSSSADDRQRRELGDRRRSTSELLDLNEARRSTSRRRQAVRPAARPARRRWRPRRARAGSLGLGSSGGGSGSGGAQEKLKKYSDCITAGRARTSPRRRSAPTCPRPAERAARWPSAVGAAPCRSPRSASTAPLPAQRARAGRTCSSRSSRSRSRSSSRTRGRRSIFFASALGVIPTAALMGRATEELAARSGPGIGGLLNVTFGNAPELIIALFALARACRRSSRPRWSARSSATSCSSWAPRCSSAASSASARRSTARPPARSRSMLLLAVVALAMPAIFQLVEGGGLPEPRAPSRSTSAATSSTLSVARRDRAAASPTSPACSSR